MAESPRRFPTPWRADKIAGGYVVRDASGQSIAYVYSRETEVEARQANVLTKDEARRIAVNIARLPELLGSRVRLAAALAFGSAGTIAAGSRAGGGAAPNSGSGAAREQHAYSRGRHLVARLPPARLTFGERIPETRAPRQ
jgi:hypothetical protein